MRFSAILTEAKAWLQQEGRITYRALQVEFDLADEHLDILKEELIEAQELAVDKDGKMLVWTGTGNQGQASKIADSGPRTPDSRPVSYTPQHLAEHGQVAEGITQIDEGLAAW